MLMSMIRFKQLVVLIAIQWELFKVRMVVDSVNVGSAQDVSMKPSVVK